VGLYGKVPENAPLGPILPQVNSAYLNSSYTENIRRPVCVTCVWAGVDSAWEQKKLEARKMLENAAESHTSGARFVSPLFILLIN